MLSTAAAMGVDLERVAIRPQLHLRDPRIEHVGWAIKAELETPEPLGRLYAESLGLALAAHVLRTYGPTRPIASGARLPQRRLTRVLDFVRTNIASDLSMSEPPPWRASARRISRRSSNRASECPCTNTSSGGASSTPSSYCKTIAPCSPTWRFKPASRIKAISRDACAPRSASPPEPSGALCHSASATINVAPAIRKFKANSDQFPCTSG